MQDIRLVAILLNCIKEIKKTKARLVVKKTISQFSTGTFTHLLCAVLNTNII